MDNKIILTIGRQFGSGGREIGQRLAKELGIGYYDKELITVAARESGLCEDVFEKADERASSGLSYAFTMGYSSFMGGMFTPYNDILSNDGLFKIQSVFLIIAKWSTTQNLFFVYDNNEIHTNIFNEYTNTFTGENVLPERKISPKIIKQNGTKNITMYFKKLT